MVNVFKWDNVTIKLYTLIISTLIYGLIELIVGWIYSSVTLQADGYHMLADLAALIVALIGHIFASRSWSKSTFGWARSEILGALINSLLLFTLAGEILSDSINAINESVKITEVKLVLIVGSGGFIFNLFGFCLLYDLNPLKLIIGHFSKSKVSKKDRKSISKSTEMNLRGAALHLLADLFSSLLVIISTVINLTLNYDWIIFIDPVLSFVPALILLTSAWRLLRESILILLETVPSHIKVETIKKCIINLPLVESVHEFHLWRLSGDVSIASLHCIFSTPADYIASIREIKHILCDAGVHSTTIQPEFLSQPFTIDTGPSESSTNYVKYCQATSQSCEGQTCCST
ncbi:proton-coupled zinc antiporter SLC30A1-like [Panonychus citri]|uniref:proton-coupled zinc antiporter SLC30A1-like n=1 Tax=Panonychus citri TaxID=50023 RepID=UPI0023074BCF|nr:proton-coupled zinc antiporter SLC30A1-like [Panonychus citri]